MKSLIATSVLFILLIGTVAANFFFVNRITDCMEQMVKNLPDIDNADCVVAAQELQEYWESRCDLLGLSLGYNLIDRVCEQSALLLTCAEIRDVYGYYSARTLLLDAIDDARRTENFSIRNLL